MPRELHPITVMIEWVKERSDQMLVDIGRTHREPGFIEEFRTLRLNAPRRSGHTTAAIDMLHIHPKSLVVVPTPRFKTDIYPARFRERIFAIEQIHTLMRGDLIIFDPASLIDDNTVKAVQKLQHPDAFYLFLS